MQFTIILEPKGQKRARSRAINSNGRSYAMTYKDKGQRQEEDKLITLMYAHRHLSPYKAPSLWGSRRFCRSPKSKPKKWQAAAIAGLIRPTTKPDLDNCIKNLKDVCKGVFWEDDKQVVEYLPGTGKYYGYPARWEITIEEVELCFTMRTP